MGNKLTNHILLSSLRGTRLYSQKSVAVESMKLQEMKLITGYNHNEKILQDIMIIILKEIKPRSYNTHTKIQKYKYTKDIAR